MCLSGKFLAHVPLDEFAGCDVKQIPSSNFIHVKYVISGNFWALLPFFRLNVDVSLRQCRMVFFTLMFSNWQQ